MTRDDLTPAQRDLLREEPMLQLFFYGHLPPRLGLISKPFCDLAWTIAAQDGNTMSLPRNPERSACLRKLREAKDCAVTAALWSA